MSCVSGSGRAEAARVVVVGGSFGGLQVAKELSGYGAEVSVVVIEPKNFFEFTPSIHTAIAGGRDPASLVRPLDANLVRGVEFVQGRAVGMSASSVELDDGRRVEFDFLVVATGCGYASPIRSAETDRAKRLEALRQTSAELDAAETVLVVGGGAVGVEICGELAARTSAAITLATNAPDLVSDCPVATRRKTLDTLRAQKVDVVFGCRAESVGPGEYSLRKPGAEHVAVRGQCLWCFGGKPQTDFCRDELALDDRGFVAVDPRTRQCLDKPNCYAVGDVAAKPDAQRLASYAHLEGEFVAYQILAALRRRGLDSYAPPPRFVALSLGPSDGAFVYDSAAFPIPGFLVPHLKTIIELWFIRLLPMPYALLKLLPGDKQARLWAKHPRPAAAAAAQGGQQAQEGVAAAS